MVLKVGDSVPKTLLQTVELSDHEKDSLTCAMPSKYEFKDGKYLVVSFPGAFSPTCSQDHLPDYLVESNLKKIVDKGYKVVFLSSNDPFVQQAFAKALGVDKNSYVREHVKFVSDVENQFSKNFGLVLNLKGMGMGERTGRYSMVIVDGVVKYIGNEEGGDVTVSGYKSAVTHLV